MILKMSDTNLVNYRDLATIRTKSMEALSEALGTVGIVYFLGQFSGGSGNWTEERKSVLAGATEADFEKDLAALRKNSLMWHKGD
jgi:3-hydroxyisobutyrate dehydrogenase-like beta-hydroxyacid dehydrogenase